MTSRLHSKRLGLAIACACWLVLPGRSAGAAAAAPRLALDSPAIAHSAFLAIFPSLKQTLAHSLTGNARRILRFRDGVLAVTSHQHGAYDAGYVLSFIKPNMPLAEAKSVLAALAAEPIDLGHPRNTPGTLRFLGRIWPATGEATAQAEIRVARGKAYRVIYEQNQSAE